LRAFSEKQLRAERSKNYAKNVKDMYMPRYGSSKVLPNLPEPTSEPDRRIIRRGITAEANLDVKN